MNGFENGGRPALALRRARQAMAVALLCAAACSNRERPPPEVPGVDLGRLTTRELELYRRALQEELSPCGGGETLDASLRGGSCPLATWAARFVAYRVEQDDTREELAERYLARYGAARRHDIPLDESPVVGDADAPVTLVVFSDFLCPHCARAAQQLRSFVDERQGRLKMSFRNFPVHRGRGSEDVAVAALAAHKQGRFWEAHDAFFDSQRDLSSERIIALAEELGLDVDQFRDDLLDPALAAQVQTDRQLGERLGVHGTPSIFINGRRFDEPIARLEPAVDEELARSEMNPPAPAASKTVGTDED